MTDVLELAEQHLDRVKRSGSDDIMAVCPFHQKSDGTTERTPSFAMNIRNGLWYCHSCHARGNLRTFLRNIGLPPGTIELHYKALIEQTSAYIPEQPDPLRPTAPTKELLYEGLLGLFEHCPVSLLEEGFTQETLRLFDVGFDEKHERVTFPLRDMRGRLVGISGRAAGSARPRYKVYDKEYLDFGLPERKTEKRALLWNYHNVLIEHAFSSHADDRFIVVVEGFKAAMRVAQAGISSVVAILGSYLSKEQQWALERVQCPLLFMLDNNDAGRRGQLDACGRLVKTVRELFVVDYDADQPSDLTSDAILTAILQARPYLCWAIQTTIHYQQSK